MRILILLRDQSPNGINTYNRTLAHELTRQGHEVFVWPSSELMQPDRPYMPAIMHPKLEFLLRPLLRKIRPDVVYAHLYTPARLAQRFFETSGIPWVACMHNGHSAKRMAEWAELFKGAAGVVTLCENMRDVYAQLMAEQMDGAARQPPILLSRLPMDIPPQTPRPARLASDAPLTLAYCSRLSGQKGPRCESWLKAIASLPDPQQYRVLVIGGGTHLSQLKKCAADLKLRVEFTGMIADPRPLLAKVDVMSGAGYALMEGLVHGCEGVALGFGGCFGALNDDNLEAAFAVNFGDHCPRELPSDPATIAAALSLAIAAARAPEKSTVPERCAKQFSPERITRELVEFLGSVSRRH